ncbi:hypothetical protein COBT_002547 [Conglomerata obtusa]
MESRKQQTIIVQDLEKTVDLQTLLNHFKSYGVLSGLKIASRIRGDKETNVGFVMFKDSEDSQRMMKQVEKKTVINGKEVMMEFAQFGRGKRNDAYGKAGFYRTKLFVTGIPKDYNEEKISALLGKCKLFVPKDGKGYCFADYHDEESKNEAIARLDGKMLDSEHHLKLAPAFYGKRDERRGNDSYGYRKKNEGRREKILD